MKFGKPYEEFIQLMVESGYYNSAEEVIQDALRDKMQNELLNEVYKKDNTSYKKFDKEKKAKSIEFISELLINMKKKSEELKNQENVKD